MSLILCSKFVKKEERNLALFQHLDNDGGDKTLRERSWWERVLLNCCRNVVGQRQQGPRDKFASQFGRLTEIDYQ